MTTTITAHSIFRAIKIRYCNLQSSAYLIDWNDKQLIVTARHAFEVDNKVVLLNGGKTNIKITLIKNDTVHEVMTPVTVYFHANNNIDLAVLTLEQKLITGLRALMSTFDSSVVLGEQVYLLGFPLDLHGKAENLTPFVIPIIKTGWIAGTMKEKDGSQNVIVDATAHHGYSGGALIRSTSNREVSLIGIIRGGKKLVYEAQFDSQNNSYELPNATAIEVDSSLCYATSSKHIKEIIDLNNL